MTKLLRSVPGSTLASCSMYSMSGAISRVFNGWPKSRTVPSVGWYRRASSFINVVLPQSFPPPTEVKTVFVEADILGELSHYSCIDYIFNDPRIQACGSTKDEVAEMMLKVGFSKKMMADPVTTLSGGWRMKLALSRAMSVTQRQKST